MKPSVLLTAQLPGTGGLLKTVPEDFVVEEIPAYLPSGEGAHTYLWIEKRGRTTDEAVRALAAALKVNARDAGTAGMKDRHAVTRQWVSLPGVDPARALALSLDGVQVLEAKRHNNKLKTGHLRGNRFTLTVRGVGADACDRATAILDALTKSGVLNPFGAQRFGGKGDNAARGRALVLGDKIAVRGHHERRLLISAYQSALFNRYLERRVADGLLHTVLLGDVLKKVDSGGVFVVDEAALADANARIDQRVVVVTGPMFGTEMLSPPDATPSHAREAAILEEEGITRATFANVGNLAPGTRRPLVVPLAEASAAAGPAADAIVVKFALPAGTYATEVMKEVLKTPLDSLGNLA